MRTLLLFCAILLIGIACNKCDDEPKKDNPSVPATPQNYRQIIECHEEKDWTEQELEKHLIGKWDWRFEETIGGFTGASDTTWEHVGLEVDFLVNNLITISEDWRKQDFFWEVRASTNNSGFQLWIAGNDADYLKGDLYVCDDNFVLWTSGPEWVILNYYIRRE